MPFAELPSSPGFQLPPTPDWTKFALQSNEALAHRPIPDYSEAVAGAAEQINKILQMSSPEGKLERRLKIMQLAAMEHTWADYNAHPDNYLLTAHGPIHKDPDAELLKGAHLKQSITATALNMQKLKQAQESDNTSNFFQGLRQKAGQVFGSNDYGNLPVKTREEPATAVGGTTEPTEQATDQTADPNPPPDESALPTDES